MDQSFTNKVTESILLISIYLAAFITIYNTMIVNVIIVPIANDFHASATDLEWVINCYFLIVASLVVTGARLGDRFGNGKVYIAGICIMLIGSGLFALSNTIASLIAARLLIGFSVVLVSPTSLSLMKKAIRVDRQHAAFALWGTSVALGLALSPLIAGIITEWTDWRWVVWFCIPILLLSLVTAIFPLNKIKLFHSKVKIDLVGTLILGISSSLLLVFLINGYDWGVTSNKSLLSLGLSVLGFCLLLWVETKVHDPLIHVNILKERNFMGWFILIILFNFIFIAFILIFNLYFQNHFTYQLNTFDAGLLFLCAGSGCVLFSLLTKITIKRFSVKTTVIIGFLLLATGSISMAQIVHFSDNVYFYLPLFLFGGGLGFLIAPTQEAALGAVEPSLTSDAVGITNIIRYLGAAVGVAVSSFIYFSFAKSEIKNLLKFTEINQSAYIKIDNLIVGHKNITGATLNQIIDPAKKAQFMLDAKAAINSAFAANMYTMAAIAIACAIICYLVIQNKTEMKPQI
ncbi:MAG: MFS transporter [bacterium]|nr:MFS transporter [bacterium]